MASENDEDKSLKRAESSSSNENNDAINSEIISIGGTIILSIIASRILSSISRIATALAAPLAGLYLMSTCPSDESFEGKRELKRVLRGEKLPDDHPDKPKSFFEKTIAKVNATIQAETDAFVGCQVEIVDLMGCVKVASIMSQTQGKYYYWLGAVHKWRYLFARDATVGETKKD